MENRAGQSSAPITPSEQKQVTEKAIEVVVEEQSWRPNGCTGVPDIWVECCNEHDRDYYEQKISRAAADRKFRRCMQTRSRLGALSPVAFWRWCGVRVFGRFFYKAKDAVQEKAEDVVDAVKEKIDDARDG